MRFPEIKLLRGWPAACPIMDRAGHSPEAISSIPRFAALDQQRHNLLPEPYLKLFTL